MQHIETVIEIPADARPAIDELRLIGGDELVREMLSTFVRFAESAIHQLEDAVAGGQMDFAAGVAHTLKSSARQMGALALGEASSAAELASRGGDGAAVDLAMADVRRTYAAAKPWLESLAGS